MPLLPREVWPFTLILCTYQMYGFVWVIYVPLSQSSEVMLSSCLEDLVALAS